MSSISSGNFSNPSYVPNAAAGTGGGGGGGGGGAPPVGNQSPLAISAVAAEKFSAETAAKLLAAKDEEIQKLKLQLLNINQAKEAAEKREADWISVAKEVLYCVICMTTSPLHRILGPCGHSVCEPCLFQLDNVAFESLTKRLTSARQHLNERRCPTCKTEIVGFGFKSLGHLKLGRYLLKQQQPAAAEPNFKPMSAESSHIHALQVGCHAQSELAKISVDKIIADKQVSPRDWKDAVMILFGNGVSRVFYETYATYINGKKISEALGKEIGELNVSTSASVMMLLVWSHPGFNPQAETHKVVRVATDGRYTVTTTAEAKPEKPPASAAAGAAVNGFAHRHAGAAAAAAASGSVSPNNNKDKKDDDSCTIC